MTVPVWFHPTALEQLESLDTWWREHRPAAAEQVTAEIERIVALLQETPSVGSPYQHAVVPGVRAVRLKRTPYRLYYVYDESAGEIVVLAVWSAMRGHGPPI